MSGEEKGPAGENPQSEGKRKFLGRTETLFVIFGAIFAGLSAAIYVAGYEHTRAEDSRKAEEEAKKAKNEQGYGACELKPQQRANVARLQAYVQEGVHYANLKNYDLAARKFKQVLDIDRLYLGANQNLGIVQMAEGDLNRAQNSFDAELKAIECLSSVPPDDRYRFAYSINEVAGTKTTFAEIDKWLTHAEARVHYNMACAYIKEKKLQSAKAELEKAATLHGIPQRDVEEDHDLDPVRDRPGFRSVLSSFTE